MSQKTNRFSCLKSTEDNSTDTNRTNRFQGPSKVINSRWQRSKSPEKNAFQKRKMKTIIKVLEIITIENIIKVDLENSHIIMEEEDLVFLTGLKKI